jgi:hypothetical protein
LSGLLDGVTSQRFAQGVRMTSPSSTLSLLKYCLLATGTRDFFTPDHWGPLAVALIQFVVFIRWIYRRIRNDELHRAFVEDMATNHLPHIYDALNRLCRQQGIDLDASPPIRWIDLKK